MALGPLTNLAIALLADPALAFRLKQIVIMGGNTEVRQSASALLYWRLQGIGNVTETAEFNFHADPEAASTVLRLARCPVTIATWELSYKYNFIPLSWRKELLGKLDTSAAVLINKLEEVMRSERGRVMRVVC